MRRGLRLRASTIAAAVAAGIFLAHGSVLGALESVVADLSALGGSPLLLNVALDDPDGKVTSVVVETAGSRFERSVPADDRVGEHLDDPDTDSSTRLSFTVDPFPKAGVHNLLLELHSELNGIHAVDRRGYRVAFVDYRWGRDNFSFANDSRYRRNVDSYSQLLFPWVEERFGTFAREDLAILLLQSYEILRGQLGLCYAFAGGAVRYYRYPELLPRFSETIYEVRETNRIVREEMSRLQNDIVFQRFVKKGVSTDPQDYRQAAGEVQMIRAAIDRGEPAVVGILAPERHHAMVAYGYVEALETGIVTIIAANNWDREERDNYSNRSVENIHVHTRRAEEVGDEEPPIRWPEARHAPYRSPTHLVAVDLQREYEHDRALLEQFIEQRRDALITAGRNTVILEGVRSVRLTDVPDPGEEAQPSITRVNNNMIVDLPRTGDHELEITALEEEDGTYRAPVLYRIVVNRSDEEPGSIHVEVEQSTLEMGEVRLRITVP